MKSLQFSFLDKKIDFRIQKILELIGRNKTVLDLGCQDGSITKLIKQQNNLVYGIDISIEAIRLAKKSGIKIYKLDLENKFPRYLYNRFNIVFAGEIIEHIYDTDKFLENIREVLKEKGNLIITTPNVATFGRRLMLLFGQNPLLETRLGENNSGHIRYFTFKTLIKLLERHHFKITDKFSTVVNFDNQGRYQSRIVAMLFPTLGSTIIIKVVKNS